MKTPTSTAPNSVNTAHCACGSQHRFPLNTLYACPKCGLVTGVKFTEERPCLLCEHPDNVPGRVFADGTWGPCPACGGKGFMSPETAATAAYLEGKLTVAEKALAFYADEKNWWTMQGDRLCVLGRRDDFTYGPLSEGADGRHKPAADALAHIQKRVR